MIIVEWIDQRNKKALSAACGWEGRVLLGTELGGGGGGGHIMAHVECTLIVVIAYGIHRVHGNVDMVHSWLANLLTYYVNEKNRLLVHSIDYY